jgi:hypothetical protein
MNYSNTRNSTNSLFWLLLILFCILPSIGFTQAKQLSEKELLLLINKQQKEKIVPKSKPIPKPRAVKQSSTKTKKESLKRNFSDNKLVDSKSKGKSLQLSIPGSVLNVQLVHDLYSYNDEIPVIAELTSDFRFGSKILPKGALLLGKSSLKRINSRRLAINFNRLIIKESNRVKKEYPLNGIATMQDGTIGVVCELIPGEETDLIDLISFGIIPTLFKAGNAILVGNTSNSDIRMDATGAILNTSYETALKQKNGYKFKVLVVDSIQVAK